MNKTIDPRVVRTRELLLNAFVEMFLIEEYDAISVRQIVQKASVNRSTFYLHFRDKQDLYSQMQEEMLKDLTESLKYPTYIYETALNDYKKLNLPIDSHVRMFEHVQKHSSLYRKILREKEFRENVTKVMKNEVLQFRDNVWDATFMAHGSVGIILYWLERGMEETIMEMSLWLTQITLFPLGKFK